jgi:PleD family two-component response regulator
MSMPARANIPPLSTKSFCMSMTIPAGQTCSAGLVAWDSKEDAEDLLGRADEALYEAKRAGRNRTVARP